MSDNIKIINIKNSRSSKVFLSRLIEEVNTTTFSQNPHRHTMNYTYYYRGTSNYNYKLISYLLREFEPDFENINSWSDFHKNNLNIIRRIIDFYNRFSDETFPELRALELLYEKFPSSNLIHPPENNQKNILAYMQHYSQTLGLKTPFLDLTRNFFIALFFAVNSISENEEDGAVWLINREFYFAHFASWYDNFPGINMFLASNLNSRTVTNYISIIKQLSEIRDVNYPDQSTDFTEIKNSPDKIKILMKNLLVFFNGAGKKAHSVIEENLYDGGFNERLCRQQGLFILQSFLPVCITKEIYNPKLSCPTPFIKIRIPAKHKKYISDFLDRVMGINEKSLFLKRDTAEELVHEQT